MTFTVTLGSSSCSSVELHVPSYGPWFADCVLADGVVPQGAVQLVIGDVTLSGTVEPRQSGTFGAVTAVRVIAGGAGWGRSVPARSYVNDAGVKASRVANDIASEAGERLGSLPQQKYPDHYERRAGLASRVLDDIASGAWWVDYGGVTQVGKRFSVAAGAGAVALDYDPADALVTLAVDSLNDVPIGAQLTDSAARWAGSLTVASLRVVVTPDSLRVHAWCGTGSDRLVETLRALITQLQPPKLWGLYRYRVLQMNGDRVDLQAVSKVAGLPDIVTVDMWPGVSGAHAHLAKGSQVGVGFFGGDASDPYVGAYGGRRQPGAVPDGLDIGGDGGALAARQGDTVEVLLPPAIASGTLGGTPFTAVLTFPIAKTLGSITGGSAAGVRIK